MDIKDIINEIIEKGFYRKDDLLFIYNKRIYLEKYRDIEKAQIQNEHKKSFPFAVFRGNLYNFHLGASLNDDYKLYCKYIYNKRLINLQLNSILLSKELLLDFSSSYIKHQFESEMNDINKTLIINSFHYSAYKLILPYFLINNCDVHLIATPRVIKDNQEKTYLFSMICNELYKTSSSAFFINAEDYLSLIKLYEVLSKRNFNRKQILLIFPDGNIGSDRKNENNKNLFKINFHNANIHIRQGIFSFAKVLLAPVFNILAESNKEYISMHFETYFDFKNENIQPDEFTAMLFKSFEKFLILENIPKWECMMYLHTWIDKPEINKNRIVNKNTFEEERYTYFEIDDKQYIFDSKYFLSLEVESNNIKKCVLQNSFYL
jgi:hypothetical protein